MSSRRSSSKVIISSGRNSSDSVASRGSSSSNTSSGSNYSITDSSDMGRTSGSGGGEKTTLRRVIDDSRDNVDTISQIDRKKVRVINQTCRYEDLDEPRQSGARKDEYYSSTSTKRKHKSSKHPV